MQISDTLAVVPAGRPEPNPLSGLSSGRMKRLVADAASQFDWVIVDSPPVGVLADAHLVSETVDGAILVVRAGVTQFPDVAAAADTLGQERILGIVLNAVDPAEIRGKGYYQPLLRQRTWQSLTFVCLPATFIRHQLEHNAVGHTMSRILVSH